MDPRLIFQIMNGLTDFEQSESKPKIKWTCEAVEPKPEKGFSYRDSWRYRKIHDHYRDNFLATLTGI